jgi:hypothetical protein
MQLDALLTILSLDIPILLFIIYYPQGNGQGEPINKVFGTLLTKLVN